MILFDIGLAVILTFCELTWIHSSLAGGVMRSGEVYNPQDASIVAVGIDSAGEPLIPLGTKLTICTPSMLRCADAVVSDTGYLGSDLDASEALFKQLSPLSAGRIKIIAVWWR